MIRRLLFGLFSSGFSVGTAFAESVPLLVLATLGLNGFSHSLLASPQAPMQQPHPKANGPIEVITIADETSAKLSLLDTRRDILAFTRRLQSATKSAGNVTEPDFQQEPAEQQVAAIVDLCGLYLTVIGDPRFLSAEPLQGFRSRIAGRLQQEVKNLKRELLSAENSKTADQDKASRDLSVVWKTPEKDNHKLVTAFVDPHWNLLSHFVGGSGPISYHASGFHGSSGHFLRGMAAGEPFDNGPELVALIEAILHPDFWQSAGGSGKIVYYRPLRIMVIRATTTVHEDLEEFLERLR